MNNIAKYRAPKTSELIANDLREKIIRGDLKAGEFLPPETQLMIELGISRPTLREAYRILESQKLIEVVRGSRSGAKILEPNIENISFDFGLYLQYAKVTIADIYQARLVLEPELVARLAQSENRDFLNTLKAKCEALRILVESEKYKDFPRAIADFDLAMVALCENKTLYYLNKIVLDMVVKHQLDFQNRFKQSNETLRKRYYAGYKSCLKLVGLIEEYNTKGATEHWKLHLANVATGWTIHGEGSRVFESMFYDR